MNRNGLKRLLVLTEIADDYEEPGHIYENVAKEAKLCGMAIEPSEILKILVDLIESGEAKAYRLLPVKGPAGEVQGVPSLDELGDYYFWITKKGLEARSSSADNWPFDGEGELLPGWSSPAE
jgi:hypothetical protein